MEKLAAITKYISFVVIAIAMCMVDSDKLDLPIVMLIVGAVFGIISYFCYTVSDLEDETLYLEKKLKKAERELRQSEEYRDAILNKILEDTSECLSELRQSKSL